MMLYLLGILLLKNTKIRISGYQTRNSQEITSPVCRNFCFFCFFFLQIKTLTNKSKYKIFIKTLNHFCHVRTFFSN